MMWPFRPTDHRILDLRRKLQGMTAVATQLRAEKARLVEANKTLQQLVDIGMSVQNTALAERLELREQIARMDAEHADLSGQLQTALERIAELEECL